MNKSTGAVFLVMLILASEPAHAYLDPGSGSMLLQIILGGIAGLVVAGKLFWHQILTFLRIRKPVPEEEQQHAGVDDA